MSNHICIKTYLHRHEAEMDRTFLESNDIEALIYADDLGGLAPGMVFGSHGVRLMVAEEQAEEALGLLASMPGTHPPG